VIHYHGTPITPRERLLTMAGRHFCVSHAAPGDLATCLRIGASVMLDNGAFSMWTRGARPDWPAFYAWAAPHLRHPHWAVIPDVIDGDEEANDALLDACPLPREYAAPVWHLHESMERLRRLAAWPRICFGSSGEYAQPGTPRWVARVTEAWNALDQSGHRPWVHMLRAMEEAGAGPWPFRERGQHEYRAQPRGGSRQASTRTGVDGYAH
jgi:hypothetical protein